MVAVPVLVRRLTATLPLLLALGCSRLQEHPLVVEAVAEMRANQRVAERLGRTVVCSNRVRGTANETDGIAHLEFEATGDKAAGVVVVEGKKTRGEWGVTLLELRPAGGGEKLSLTADLEARVGVDTPAFDPNAEAAAGTSTPAPPSEIEIKLPPGPPGQ